MDKAKAEREAKEKAEAEAKEKAEEAERAKRKAELEAQMKGEQPIPEGAKPANAVPVDVARAVHRLNADFTRDIPQHARGGIYGPMAGDAFDGQSYAIPDGTYRPHGSDWFYTVKDGELAAAAIADATNKFGGKNVVEVYPA